MKIQREGESYDEISFYLRFVNIPEAIVDSLLSELSDFKVESRRSKREPTSFVLLVDLNQSSFNISIIKELIVKYRVPDGNFGLWISMRSEFDHGGFTLPENVANLYHELKGSLNVSYTIA